MGVSVAPASDDRSHRTALSDSPSYTIPPYGHLIQLSLLQTLGWMMSYRPFWSVLFTCLLAFHPYSSYHNFTTSTLDNAIVFEPATKYRYCSSQRRRRHWDPGISQHSPNNIQSSQPQSAVAVAGTTTRILGGAYATFLATNMVAVASAKPTLQLNFQPESPIPSRAPVPCVACVGSLTFAAIESLISSKALTYNSSCCRVIVPLNPTVNLSTYRAVKSSIPTPFDPLNWCRVVDSLHTETLNPNGTCCALAPVNPRVESKHSNVLIPPIVKSNRYLIQPINQCLLFTIPKPIQVLQSLDSEPLITVSKPPFVKAFTVDYHAFSTITSATVNSNCCRVIVKQSYKNRVSPNIRFKQYKWCHTISKQRVQCTEQHNQYKPISITVAVTDSSVIVAIHTLAVKSLKDISVIMPPRRQPPRAAQQPQKTPVAPSYAAATATSSLAAAAAAAVYPTPAEAAVLGEGTTGSAISGNTGASPPLLLATVTPAPV